MHGSAPLAGGYAAPKRPKSSWKAPAIACGTVVVVAIALLAVGSVYLLSDDSSTPAPVLLAGDESVHPDEAASMVRPPAPAVLAPLPKSPTPVWTHTAPAGSADRILDGTDSLLVVGDPARGTTVTGLDPASGRERFTTKLPDGLVVAGCAVSTDRIGCAAGVADHPSELVVLDTSGRVVARGPMALTSALRDITAVGDHFVVSTDATSGGSDGTTSPAHAQGYDRDARPVFSKPGSVLFPDAGVLVSSPAGDPDAITLVDATDGRAIVTVNQSNTAATRWSVFATGIAVLNATGDGTDFYNPDGNKTASLRGWAPAVDGSADAGTPTAVPIVKRLAARGYETSTIAGVNPATGHLLWQHVGSEFAIAGMSGRQLGDAVALRVATPGRPTSLTRPTGATADRWRLYDPYTGASVSTFVVAPPTSGLVGTDGTRLVLDSATAVTAFDRASGAVAWTAPADHGVRAVGPRLFGAGASLLG